MLHDTASKSWGTKITVLKKQTFVQGYKHNDKNISSPKAYKIKNCVTCSLATVGLPSG
jgi:hypothetical protein